MKKLVLVFFTGIIMFSGCTDSVVETMTYMINEPVFMSEEAFRKSVVVTPEPQPISKYGKMCFYEGYIYIAESEKGIHIIDNIDPANPQNVGFIEMIGNADLAIRNGKLYADALIDLVWFDISDPAKPELEGRLENVFSQYMPLPLTDNEYGIDYSLCYDEKGIKGLIVGWELKQRIDTINSTVYNERFPYLSYRNDIDYSLPTTYYGVAEASYNGKGGSVGLNGSMSRFALYKNYLYTVINNCMSVIDLSGDEPVKAADNIYIGWNVETIFSYKDNMFMGTPTGMVIFSVDNPLQPVYISSVTHVFGCDPVVVENDIAYVTIHSGNNCGQLSNDLIIYDVSDVKTPQLLFTYAMTKPKGLGIDNNILFVCDDGLKVFDATDPRQLMANRLAHFTDMDGFDVIPFNNVLMMIADDGLYQYDYSDNNEISLLSKIPIFK